MIAPASGAHVDDDAIVAWLPLLRRATRGIPRSYRADVQQELVPLLADHLARQKLGDGAPLRFLRLQAWGLYRRMAACIHIPSGVQQGMVRAQREAAKRNGPVSRAEMVAISGLSDSTYWTAEQMIAASKAMHSSQVAWSTDHAGRLSPLEMVGVEDERLQGTADRIDGRRARELIGRILPERYAAIFLMRCDGMTFPEIGTRFGISSTRAQQIHREGQHRIFLLLRRSPRHNLSGLPVSEGSLAKVQVALQRALASGR